LAGIQAEFSAADLKSGKVKATDLPELAGFDAGTEAAAKPVAEVDAASQFAQNA
jgi:hypothetical protein